MTGYDKHDVVRYDDGTLVRKAAALTHAGNLAQRGSQ